MRFCNITDRKLTKVFYLTAAGLAETVERLTAEREVTGSIPGPDQYSGS